MGIKTRNINRDMVVSGATATGTNFKPQPDTTEKVSADVTKGMTMDYAAEFAKAIGENPELTKLAVSINETDGAIKDLEAKKAKIMKDISKAHP